MKAKVFLTATIVGVVLAAGVASANKSADQPVSITDVQLLDEQLEKNMHKENITIREGWREGGGRWHGGGGGGWEGGGRWQGGGGGGGWERGGGGGWGGRERWRERR